jgi:hypothetical protein
VPDINKGLAERVEVFTRATSDALQKAVGEVLDARNPWQLLYRLSRIVLLGLVLYTAWLLITLQPDLAKRMSTTTAATLQEQVRAHQGQVQTLLRSAIESSGDDLHTLSLLQWEGGGSATVLAADGRHGQRALTPGQQPLLGVEMAEALGHARRPWRLAITQALSLPAPVEWIGWWLYTPLATCLQWNQTRKRLVPEPVIREMAAALADPVFGPSRAEGFAAVVAVVPTHQRELQPLLGDELARLDHRIRSARNREKHFALHGYSRLLDLERLLYLLRLLSTYPELSTADPASRAELEAIVSPLPEGDLADQAAAYLRRLHGECYGDATAIRSDLAWLAANGFCQSEASLAPIQPPPPVPL